MAQLVVLYDASCGLCTRAMRYAMHHANRDRLRFIPNDSDEAIPVLQSFGLLGAAGDTMVAYDASRGKAYIRSAAVVQVAARLRWPYRAQAALWLVPKPLREAGYRAVARRRHAVCELPPPH